jgi:Arc/MetJ-type ribon-helix-helix transcriptional regulator
VTTFDYSTAAELFAASNRWPKRQVIEYRRFASAADAIRFAIEELPPKLLAGAYLEVDEERFDRNAIRQLYESADYPLTRGAPARQQQRFVRG